MKERVGDEKLIIISVTVTVPIDSPASKFWIYATGVIKLTKVIKTF